MRTELFQFQRLACIDLRVKTAEAMAEYRRTACPQVVSFTAPTGAGKTIILASLMENILFGDDMYPDQRNAIFVWLSDSPQLNEQSKQKIDLQADKILLSQCITIQEDSFDQETLDDGCIYFLNTQKLGKNSNLVSNGDKRTYSIWETIANTVKEKGDRLYFIIDEAHRGAQKKRETANATTIMQKFIKGSKEDGIPPMPVVIGMSATMERFNKLVEGTTSTIRKCIVTADQVRSSGLLKDRIIITYPEENTIGTEMAVLQAAADDWKQKWDHWSQYCREQHHAYINPIFVVQVQSGSGDKLSDTDLDDCLCKIEDRVGYHFKEGEVVHTFGQTSGFVRINGLDVKYVEPSRIADDRKIKVVLFKENLSTGWDCPRAETMMSFRRAVDATYIAQLLGRMVRTPMQMRIQVDDLLNDVNLYLPHFDSETVQKVIDEFQGAEGGNITEDIYGKSLDQRVVDTLTIRSKSRKRIKPQISGQTSLWGIPDFQGEADNATEPSTHRQTTVASQSNQSAFVKPSVRELEPAYEAQQVASSQPTKRTLQNDSAVQLDEHLHSIHSHVDESAAKTAYEQEEYAEYPIEREEIARFINEDGLLTYNVRSVKINNYLTSLFKMAHLLSQSGLYVSAPNDIKNDIVQMIRSYVEQLKADGLYDELVKQAKEFELQAQIYDIFGQSVEGDAIYDTFTTTDTDIERQFRLAESKLGSNGVGNEYGRQYVDWNDPDAFKFDVILFADDAFCIGELNNYAKEKFHSLNDDFRRRIAKINSDKVRQNYDSIVSDGDIVSVHNFRLPSTIQVPHENGGQEYSDHLFVDEDTGVAKIKLNAWEAGTLEEERQRDDYVCWIRNPSRGSWALSIPYQYGDEQKAMYPDLIIIRCDESEGYIVDILEPHQPTLDDNLGKAKGLAEYAKQNPGVGRIQLIRMGKDAAGQNRFKRLDMAHSETREKVSHITSQDELNHLFDTDGFFM